MKKETTDVRTVNIEDYLKENNSDFIEYKMPLRFLFGRDNGFMRLFWVKYENDELYLGSSLHPIMSAGKQDVKDVIISEDNSFRIEVDEALKPNEYNSLKFSFHSSGVRHLKMINTELKTEELYREKYVKMEELEKPEMLFIILSKKISLYQDYKRSLTKGYTTAIVFKTPQNYMECREVFEFYICNEARQNVPTYIIKGGMKFEQLRIKLKENIYLHVKFVINNAENNLNSMYADREILLFKNGNSLKSFSFK
jgi:hypothetical protein